MHKHGKTPLNYKYLQHGVNVVRYLFGTDVPDGERPLGVVGEHTAAL